jgi:phosphoglycerate dehydrogenase-like enzyme
MRQTGEVGKVDTVNVLVMAPMLGRDLTFIRKLNERVRVLDGNDAYAAELAKLGIAEWRPAGQVPSAPPPINDLLAEAEVVVMSFPVLPVVAARAPRLRWLHHTQAGVSNLWGSDVWTSDLVLTSGRGVVGTGPIAEYVIAGAMFFARGLHQGTLDKRKGQMHRSQYGAMATLRGATMGVIGLGGIGKEVARLARGLGMRVVATRRSVTAPQEDAEGVDLLLPSDRLMEMAAQSDFLAVCSQRTAETEKFINRAVLAAMKPSAVLINIARGEEVDEDALVEALREERIGGAVLDVYDGELEGRPPRRELLELPNVLLTPHISPGGDRDFVGPIREMFLQNLRRYLAGQPLINVVDRARGY